MDGNRVLAAIAELEAAGEGITCRAVQALSKGSMRDVAYYVAEWREGRLVPESDFARLAAQLDDLRARIGEDRALRRQHAHTKELIGLLLQAVRSLANHPPPSEPPLPPVVRLRTRQERSAYNKAAWAELRLAQRLLGSRYRRRSAGLPTHAFLK